MTLSASWLSLRPRRRYYSTITKLPHVYWSFITGIGLVSTGTGGSGTVVIPLGPFRPIHAIAGFGVVIQPSAGHGSLPSTMPRARLYRSSPSLTPASPVGTAVDLSATVAAYEALHEIETSFDPVRTSGSFWIEFDDEAGVPISAMILVDIFVVMGHLVTAREDDF